MIHCADNSKPAAGRNQCFQLKLSPLKTCCLVTASQCRDKAALSSVTVLKQTKNLKKHPSGTNSDFCLSQSGGINSIPS